MTRRQRAAELAETITAVIERPKGIDTVRKALKANAAKTLTKWLRLDPVAAKRLVAMPAEAAAMLATYLETALDRTGEVDTNLRESPVRPMVLRAMLNSMALIVIAIVDWAAGEDPSAEGQPDPDITCLEAEIKEMLAEMDLMFAAEELNTCIALSIVSSMPGPLAVPNVAGCTNELIHFNNATRSLADAQALRRLICNQPGTGGVGV